MMLTRLRLGPTDRKFASSLYRVVVQLCREVRVQQLVEELFAGFSADGESAGVAGTWPEGLLRVPSNGPRCGCGGRGS